MRWLTVDPSFLGVADVFDAKLPFLISRRFSDNFDDRFDLFLVVARACQHAAQNKRGLVPLACGGVMID